MGTNIPATPSMDDPFSPPGDPMQAGLGPSAWAERRDVPDLTIDGRPKIVPISADADFYVEPRDPDPRGFTVVGLDEAPAGTVSDIWVDRSEPQVRYLEVHVSATGAKVLLPITGCRFNVSARRVEVRSIKAEHFAHVPRTKSPVQVTFLEEDKIQAYYSGGHLYATKDRTESLIV